MLMVSYDLALQSLQRKSSPHFIHGNTQLYRESNLSKVTLGVAAPRTVNVLKYA